MTKQEAIKEIEDRIADLKKKGVNLIIPPDRLLLSISTAIQALDQLGAFKDD